MKKLVTIFLFCAAAWGAVAQVDVTMKKRFANKDVAIDTVSGTGTNYLGNLFPFQIDHDKTTVFLSMTGVVTGVVNTFKVKLQGSNDGVNFVVINGTSTGTQTGTYTGTTASTQKTVWTLSGNPFPYYRVTCTGDTTTAVVKLAAVVTLH